MKRTDAENGSLKLRRITSIVIVWILVLSGVLVFLPMTFPTTEAQKYHNTSASDEDKDAGSGVDYNGDAVDDGKIMWHAADNPHILNNNFFVEDGYILEIEAGVMIKIESGMVLQVGTGVGGTIFANGTSGSPITVMRNNTASAWQGIYIVLGSYGYFEYVNINGGTVIYVDDSTLDMTESSISDMNSAGISAIASTLSLTNSKLENTSTAALYCDSTDAFIYNNDIWGYNGTEGGPKGIDGGHGIYFTGTSVSVNISSNSIYGGTGGDNLLPGGDGGEGGHGVFDVNYDGQIIIYNNDIIKGGDGGNNTIPGQSAGEGGIGVHVMPIPDTGSVDISYNTAIYGGEGGANTETMDGIAGEGGNAIWLTDNPPETPGSAVIGYNSMIIGGDGGLNNAAWNIAGWTSGQGGNGIIVQNAREPCTVFINDNPMVVGGNGGDNLGVGDGSSSATAGDGSNGIIVWNSTGVFISKNDVFGGDGGDNVITGSGAIAGDGGNGILLYYDSVLSNSWADISGCNLTGGNGGDDWTAGGSEIGPGEGGNALYSQYSSGSCASSDLFGGTGGDNYGPGGRGGDGGMGAGFSGSFYWNLNDGNIVGGTGGKNFNPSGGGGAGGSAVNIGGTSDNIDIDGVLNIVGGEGGDADIGDNGPGWAANATIQATSSTNITLTNSDVRTGLGGFNSSGGTYGENGNFCVYGDNLGGTNILSGNDVTSGEQSGTYGIRLGSTAATVSDNDVYNNEYGVALLGSDDVTVGNINRIYNNVVGIYLSSSDADVGTGNTISNNEYGIYADSSIPTITGDQIINSSNVGLYFTSGADATVERTTVTNSSSWSVYCGGGSAPGFFNCTLDKVSGTGDFYITGNSHPLALNTTFDKDSTAFTGGASDLTVQWYLHVRVVDPSNSPIANVDVWVNDTYGTNIFTGQTPSDGWIRWLIVTEYIEDQNSGKYYYTTHNVSGQQGALFDFDITNMSMSKDVILVLGGIKLSIPLKEGWNMISIPVNVTDTAIDNILDDIIDNYVAVQWFNSSDLTDPWKHSHIDKGPMNDLFTIEREMGIWLLMKSDDVLTVAGYDPDPTITNIFLREGWNFVGYPSNTERVAGILAGEAFNNIAPFLDLVQYYDSSDPADPWKEYDPASISDLTVIKPGYGLWIHVNTGCTWTVNW